MSKKLGIIFLCSYIVAIAIYWLQIGGASTVLLRSTVFLSAPLIAILGGVFSLSVYGLKGPRAKTLLLLTIGVGCWLIGEVLFDSYEFILHSNPFPSVADVFYLLGYPLIFLGLINEIRQTSINWKKIHPSIVFLFVLVAVAFAILVLYFGVYLAYDPHETIFTNLIAIGYGVGDLLLIIVDISVLTLAWEFRRGSFSRVWILLFISFIFMLVADVLFAIYTNQYKAEVWFYRSLLDSFWMASYVLFAYGFFSFGLSILNAKSQISKPAKKKTT